jgi:hypothetical protein
MDEPAHYQRGEESKMDEPAHYQRGEELKNNDL